MCYARSLISYLHCDEIAETQGGFFMDPAKRHLVAERLPKYQSIQFPGI